MYNEIDETEEMRQRDRQTTCYVIAYDISDNKRRTKVHEILLGFGAMDAVLVIRVLPEQKRITAVAVEARRISHRSEGTVYAFIHCVRTV